MAKIEQKEDVMDRFQTKTSMLMIAISLSFLAGYVDALGFLELGGIFISFMSGNSTRLGIADTAAGTLPVFLLAGIIALFVLGVIAGSLIGRYARVRRSHAIIAFVTGLLCAAGLCDALGFSGWAVAMATLSMGAINTLFEKDGEVSIALTYMTGTLVRMGQRMAAAITGGARFGWVRYFLLWAGLVCGAVTGAFFYGLYGFSAIWFAAAEAVVLLAALARIDR